MNRSLLSGWSKLVGSNAMSGVLQFGAFAIAAQTLELAAFGMIVLVQTYVKVADGLLNFQSVNVLTRFLAEAETRGDDSRFSGLLKAGLIIDLATALLATVLAIVALPVLSPLLGLQGEWLWPAMLFCLVILTRIFGVSEAYLRCMDRFSLIGLRPLIVSLLTVAGSVVLWLQGAEARAFLFLWLLAELAGNCWFLAATFSVFRSRGHRPIRTASAGEAIANSPRFWPMMWQTNATFAIRMLSQDVDVLVAGSVFGPAAAGLLRAAKSIAGQVGQLGRPVQQVVSAPISRFVVNGELDRALRFATRICLGAGAVSLLAILAAALLGGAGLSLVFGPEFAAAKWPMVALFATAALFMFGVVMLPFGMALDRADINFRATLYGTASFALGLAFLTEPYGILGIAIASTAFNATWLCASWAMVWQEIARRNAAFGKGAVTVPAADRS